MNLPEHRREPGAVWDGLADRFIGGHYGSLRGRVRTHVIGEHLRTHLRPAPAPEVLAGQRFAGVLCHGVLMYLDDPAPLVDALCALAEPGGIVSIPSRRHGRPWPRTSGVMALRPALDGDWAAALAALEGGGGPIGDRQINGLGVRPGATMSRRSAPGCGTGRSSLSTGMACACSATAGRVVARRPIPTTSSCGSSWPPAGAIPYRQMSRRFHLVGQRRISAGDLLRSGHA